jgi:hypothetical protein
MRSTSPYHEACITAMLAQLQILNDNLEKRTLHSQISNVQILFSLVNWSLSFVQKRWPSLEVFISRP